MIDYIKAGNKIRLQRKSLGLTQEIVSEQVGISPSFLSQIESGTRKAGINTFLSLSRVLSLSLDYILGNEMTESPDKGIDEIESQITHRLKTLHAKDKKLILNIMICIQKENTKGDYSI